jgi:uncharacterized protein (TIGR02266 family)
MDRKKVLLVDDVQLFLEQQKSFFNRDEFQLLCARSGDEALRLAAEQKPDLIFMDLYMPDMNGDRCCRAIRKLPELAEVPVIMLTAGVDPSDFERCWAAGCSDIVPKPINRNYFNAVLKKHLPLAVRETPRYVARLRVRYGLEQELELGNYSINVSTGGLFIESSTVLTEGTALALSFLLPEREREIRCRGRVAWVNHPEMIKNPALPSGMGVQFLDLSLDDLQAIRDFIREGGLLPFW